MSEFVVLSHLQAKALIRGRQQAESCVAVSLDLGLTQTQVRLEPEGVAFPGGLWLPWDRIEEIAQNERACFLVQNDHLAKIQRFSERLNRFYSLMPTDRAPTLMVSGVAMHRIQGITPDQDTLRKIRTISPLIGRVLDTCTGLGYTAIEAAKTAEQVVTIELDPVVLEVARLNPWSRRVFEDPKIEQVVGDTLAVVQTFADQSFSRIIHDPPAFSLAGELYSGECYRHLYRLLKRRGRMFHYIGDLESRSGRNVARGVVRRLQEAGFAQIVRQPAAFGVVVYK